MFVLLAAGSAALAFVVTSGPADPPAGDLREGAGSLRAGFGDIVPTSEPKPVRRLDLLPPYSVADGLTFRAGDYTIRLAGLEGPDWDGVCLDGQGLPWACGLRSRAALNNEISGKPVVCESAEAGPAERMTVAACSVGGQDLATVLVAAGWARPLPSRSHPYEAQLRAAQDARRGLWNGNWHLRE
jgi:endonuclease YncB( thermonuclease family)